MDVKSIGWSRLTPNWAVGRLRTTGNFYRFGSHRLEIAESWQQMVRFDTTADDAKPGGSPHKPAPNYFSRAQQYRLLTLVFTLMLVLFMMAEAAKPKNWQWMWQLAGGQAVEEAENGAEGTIQAVPWDGGADEAVEVDTRLAERGTHPAGVFVSESSDAADEVDSADASEAQGVAAIGSNGLFPGVEKEQLSAIRDDTVFRSVESETWFRWCEIVRDDFTEKESSADARPLDMPSVTFLQLFRQPNEYRGKAIRVSGVVRRAHQVPARENEKGIQGYYRCWLFPANGSNNPIVVYALRMPDAFPTGMELHEEVSFSGVFFKRWAYQAQGGIMTAPLVLSADVAWTPDVPPPPMRTPSLPWIVLAIGVAAVVGSMVAWVVYQQSNAQSAHVRRSRARDLPETAPSLAENSESTNDVALSIYTRDEGHRE